MYKDQHRFQLKSIACKASFSIIILLLFFCLHSRAQTKVLDFEKNIDGPEVSFISKTPTIDGRLDADLEYLEIKKFNYIWQFDNPKTDTVQVTYRMAYTPTHLYVYIETNVDSVSYHRRGYLYGDGFKVLLGIPQNDVATNEYYELYFSPTQEKEYEWARQGLAYYNFNQAVKKISFETKSQEMAQNNISGFEALIAWEDVKPYHPWFMKEMGYNIYFAKGIELKQHGYITNGYSLVEDEGIWDEEVPERNYETISYENPASVTGQVILAQAKKANLQIGQPLKLEIASIDNKITTERLNIEFLDLNSKVIVSKEINIQLGKKLKKEEVLINLGSVESGRYNLLVHSTKDTIVNDVICIQPTIDFQKIAKELQENKSQLATGTTNTLQFEINEISSKLTNLKKYETGEDILVDWKLFQKKHELFLRGIDPYENLPEPYRRAFKSKYDGTYQPYSLKLPVDYNPNKEYPLLVFMHGSGRDEQGLLDKPRSGGNFIEIAPLARDIYRAYAEDLSQKDIIEAIEDVSKYFTVDSDNIVIGGFSMGGYGALRTFYEHPDLYKGVAVCAGHPNLANEWLDGEHPNFLEEKYLTSFSDIPVFIYHGEKDVACNPKLIKKMSEKLTKVGAVVTVSFVKENGHEYPDEKTNQLYFEWLNNITNR